MSFEEDDAEPEDAIAAIFAEAQGSVSSFKRVASMLGPSGSMSVIRRSIRERLRKAPSARSPRLLRRKAQPEGFSLKAPRCLLCGDQPQEYGSCRCADCNLQRRTKRSRKYRPQRIQESLS
jgi:hypothetical protein